METHTPIRNTLACKFCFKGLYLLRIIDLRLNLDEITKVVLHLEVRCLAIALRNLLNREPVRLEVLPNELLYLIFSHVDRLLIP